MELCKRMIPSLLVTLLLFASSGPWMGVNAGRDYKMIGWKNPNDQQTETDPQHKNRYGNPGDNPRKPQDDMGAWDQPRDNGRTDTDSEDDTWYDDTWGKKSDRGNGKRGDESDRNKGRQDDNNYPRDDPDRDDNSDTDNPWGNFWDDMNDPKKPKDIPRDDPDRDDNSDTNNPWDDTVDNDPKNPKNIPRDDESEDNRQGDEPDRNNGRRDADPKRPKDNRQGDEPDRNKGGRDADPKRPKDKREGDEPDRNKGGRDDDSQNEGNKRGNGRRGDKGRRGDDSQNEGNKRGNGRRGDKGRRDKPRRKKLCPKPSEEYKGWCRSENCLTICLNEDNRYVYGVCDGWIFKKCLCKFRC